MEIPHITPMMGYHVSEYLLIIDPHEELKNKIIQVKNHFFEKYKAPASRYSKAHLPLLNFVQYEMMEERIVNSIKTIAMGYAPFKVELKDFGSYPSHTIYINIDSKLQVKNLIKELKAAQRLMALNKDNKPHFFEDPSITIARKLTPWQYEQGWLEYSHHHFTGRFIADKIILIKRKEGEKAFQIVDRFQLMNLPINIQQGELFM